MAKTPVGMFGLGYEDVTAFAQKTQKTKVYFGELKEKLIYHLGAQGGALSKRLAQDCANHIRAQIYSQEAFEGMPPISPTWEEIKSQMGLDPRMGVATGDMARAIKPINQKYNRYKVGISSREHSVSPGSVKKVVEYAKMLEYGYGPIMGKDGRMYEQPPRPFFSKSFMDWAYKKLPRFIAETIHKDVDKKMEDIYDTVADHKPRYSPEDYYWISHEGEGISDIQETFQESMQQGGSTFGEESSRMRVSRAGTTGHSEGAGRDTSARVYPESKRTEDIITDAQGTQWTESGDIWNEQEGMWQDMETYMKRTGRP